MNANPNSITGVLQGNRVTLSSSRPF